MELNRKIVFITLLVITASGVHAQTFDEWFRQKKTQIKYLEQQIVALEVYTHLMQQAYGIVQGGLTVIGDLKQGDFNLHHDYFASLHAVNPQILRDGKTRSGQQVYADILKTCAQVREQSKGLVVAEQTQIELIVANLKTSAAEHYRKYQLLTSDDHYQLTDAERLEQINNTVAQLSDQYTFIWHVQQQLGVLRAQEVHEQADVSTLQQLYKP